MEPPSWTPAPRPASDYTAPSTPASPAPTQAEPVTPAGGGAAWSIVGESKSAADDVPAAKDKDKGKDKKKAKQAVAAGNAWQLESGNAPGDEEAVEVRAPSAAMAVAQYAVLVVGLVMVLIGVLVMVANQKGT